MKPSHCTEKGDAQRCEQGIFEDLDIIKHKKQPMTEKKPLSSAQRVERTISAR